MLFNLCTDLRGPQRLPGATIWNHVGILKSGVGLAGRALFQSSTTLPQGCTARRSHSLHAFEWQALESWAAELWWVRWLPKNTRYKLESMWSRGLFVKVRVQTTERIVMDETGTYVVQSVRRVPEGQRYDHRLLQNLGTSWESNQDDVSTDLPEPMLIIPQLPDVDPAPTKTYHSDNKGTRNVYIRRTDLEKFGYTAGCPACEVHRAGVPMCGQGHTAEWQPCCARDPQKPMRNAWRRKLQKLQKPWSQRLGIGGFRMASCMRPAVTSRCVKSPRHLSHTMNAVRITLTTRVASCSTTHLSRGQELRKIRSFVNLVSGRWLRDPVARSCLVRAGLTSAKRRTQTVLPRSTCRARVQTSSRWVIFESHSTARGSAEFVDLRNKWRAFQWDGTAGCMDWACGFDADWRAPGTLLQTCSEEGGCRASWRGQHWRSSEWEFAICQVMIAMSFVQGRASPCIYRHLEKQLRVWYTETISFLSVTSPMLDGSVWNCKSSGLSRIEESLEPLDTTTVCKAFECWAGSWTGLLMASLGRQIIDMQSPSVNRSAWPADQLRHVESETNLLTLKERFRSTKKHEIGIARTRCVHSVSPVTDLYAYRVPWCGTKDATAVEPGWNGTEDSGSFSLGAFEGGFGCSRGRNVLHESHPGVIETMQAVSELGRVFLVVRWCWGGSTVSTYCKGQAVIALSSGEAEHCGLVSATSHMLGLQNFLLDWGWKFNAHMWMDATAGIAIGSQRGLGRVKHIDTVFLWVQAMVTEGKISFGKKPTKEMLADFLMKHVDASTMPSWMAGLGMIFQAGESKLTLKEWYFQSTEAIAVQRRGNWLPDVPEMRTLVVILVELEAYVTTSWWFFFCRYLETRRSASVNEQISRILWQIRCDRAVHSEFNCGWG